MPAQWATPALLMGHRPKSGPRFQPHSLGMVHESRTTFDSGALVRARVRFRKMPFGEQKAEFAVALLDDLHSMNARMNGRGDMRSAWTLPRAASYMGERRPVHRHVGGLMIVRDGDHFYVYFYGPRPLRGEPGRFGTYVRVPVASAAKLDGNWELKGEAAGAFHDLTTKLLPHMLGVLMRDPLAAQTPEDERVRAEWVGRRSVPVFIMFK